MISYGSIDYINSPSAVSALNKLSYNSFFKVLMTQSTLNMASILIRQQIVNNPRIII